MRKLILPSCICAFCFTVVTSCSKDVKSPYAKTTTAAKTTSTSSGSYNFYARIRGKTMVIVATIQPQVTIIQPQVAELHTK
ncbi:MAG: hypothetical protein WKG06_37115 [Segetibacter sp.]